MYAPTGDIEGVAIWLPPKQTDISISKSLMSGVMGIPRALGNNLLKKISFARRMIAYSNYSGKLHKKYAPSPHWYLLAIGIREQYQGRGYASKLIKPMIDNFDREGVLCYLETHNPKNVDIYKHFRFEVAEECKMPGSEMVYWTMIRKPIIRTE